MGFFIASLNSTASLLFIVSSIAFVVFAVHKIGFYKQALVVAIASLLVTLVTPNKSERVEFFGAVEQVESPVTSANK